MLNRCSAVVVNLHGRDHIFVQLDGIGFPGISKVVDVISRYFHIGPAFVHIDAGVDNMPPTDFVYPVIVYACARLVPDEVNPGTVREVLHASAHLIPCNHIMVAVRVYRIGFPAPIPSYAHTGIRKVFQQIMINLVVMGIAYPNPDTSEVGSGKIPEMVVPDDIMMGYLGRVFEVKM